MTEKLSDGAWAEGLEYLQTAQTGPKTGYPEDDESPKIRTVWVLTGQTESGDDVGPYVWDYEPTREEALEVLKADWWEEYEAFESDEAINFCVESAKVRSR